MANLKIVPQTYSKALNAYAHKRRNRVTNLKVVSRKCGVIALDLWRVPQVRATKAFAEARPQLDHYQLSKVTDLRPFASFRIIGQSLPDHAQLLVRYSLYQDQYLLATVTDRPRMAFSPLSIADKPLPFPLQGRNGQWSIDIEVGWDKNSLQPLATIAWIIDEQALSISPTGEMLSAYSPNRHQAVTINDI